MNHPRFKLGKRPARSHSHLLHAADYLDLSKLPTPPAAFGHQVAVADWGMLANDTLGDCVIAGGMHETMLWCAEGKCPSPPAFSDAQAIAAYSAITGYTPADPESDQGTDMIDAAKYRLKHGFLDASGKPHQIAAYLSIRPGNLPLMAAAAYLFGAIGVGFELPQSAMDQADAGEPWSVVSRSRHAIRPTV